MVGRGDVKEVGVWDRLVVFLVASVISCSLAARAGGAEVVVKAGTLTTVGDGLALLCSNKDDRNFKRYPLRKGSTAHVVSLSWEFVPAERVLTMLSEDESSRMQLAAGGASHPPSAIGSDNPPPPPPGRVLAPTDYWNKVSNLPLYKGGGRFVFAAAQWPQDFLFELPATAGPPEALRLHVMFRGTEYAVRCDLGK
jgi:hypothetical protein